MFKVCQGSTADGNTAGFKLLVLAIKGRMETVFFDQQACDKTDVGKAAIKQAGGGSYCRQGLAGLVAYDFALVFQDDITGGALCQAIDVFVVYVSSL
ncbi:hypothetical protein [Endozoicomonas sp. 4G]|uniref:hypothetical protein n=1 Tax=Endozoicomonas sp. 4G TaxID=2872754 RepID=UPI002078D7F4|nr:hypothetical protein [Endozoicomonas sp. 4G]